MKYSQIFWCYYGKIKICYCVKNIERLQTKSFWFLRHFFSLGLTQYCLFPWRIAVHVNRYCKHWKCFFRELCSLCPMRNEFSSVFVCRRRLPFLLWWILGDWLTIDVGNCTILDRRSSGRSYWGENGQNWPLKNWVIWKFYKINTK